MKLIGLILVLLFCSPVVTAQPSTAPASDEHLFADDTLQFTVPEGWRLSKISNDSLWAEMKRDDGGGTLVLNTTLQTASLTQNPDTRIKIGEQIVKQMHDQLVAQGLEIVDRPRMKRDDAFFLRVEDRYRATATDGGKVVSRLHVYRAMGIHFLMVVATSFDESPNTIAAIHKAGEQLLYSVKPNKVTRNRGVPTGNKPALFRQAKVKLSPAKGWLEDKSDTAVGTIATYRQPIGGAVVTVRVVPMADQTDARDVVAARIAREDLAAMIVTDTQAGPVEAVTDDAFMSKSRQTHTGVRPAVRVENRVRSVGNVLLSVTSSSVEVKADAVGTWADDLAKSAEVFATR
ncbi:MAG TPA: hypothetical protein VGN72_22830 [Tepidisphaeraceae bacterium]|nr:hypothetical protein [Tepidisphaeraceae bacterium]